MPQVDRLLRVAFLDVAQRRLQPVEVHQRVVVALARPPRRGLACRRRAPEGGGLLSDDAHVRELLAPVDENEVAAARLLEIELRRGRSALRQACLIKRGAKNKPNTDTMLVGDEALAPFAPLIAQPRVGRIGHHAKDHVGFR